MRPNERRWWSALARCCLVAVLTAWTTAASPAEFRAEGLFLGTDTGNVKVRVGGGPASVPAAPFGCARCHGRDARGGAEGATKAPAIDWPSLSAATPARPAYTADSFLAALTEGRSAAGRPLDRAMPRYTIDGAMARSLADYLDELPQLERKGVRARAIAVAVPHRAGTRALAEGFAHGFRLAAEGRSFWGRSLDVRLCAADEEGSCGEAFIVAGSTVDSDFAGAGTIELAPLSPASREASYLRTIRASNAAALGALAERIGASAAGVAVVADESRFGREAARLAQEALSGRSVQRFDRLADVPAGWAVLLLGAPPSTPPRTAGIPVFGIADQIGPYLPALVSSGHEVTVADPYPELPDVPGHPEASRVERIGFVAGAVVREALLRSGRDLTRARFLASLAAAPIGVGGLTLTWRQDRMAASVEPTIIEFGREKP